MFDDDDAWCDDDGRMNAYDVHISAASWKVASITVVVNVLLVVISLADRAETFQRPYFSYIPTIAMEI